MYCCFIFYTANSGFSVTCYWFSLVCIILMVLYFQGIILILRTRQLIFTISLSTQCRLVFDLGFLFCTIMLTQSQKNRVVLVKLEEEFVNYVQDVNRMEPLKLPPWDSYHRMLAHRLLGLLLSVLVLFIDYISGCQPTLV